jgi:hypothetical protein
MAVKHVFRGQSGLSMVFHAQSDRDPTVSACYGEKIPLYLEDPLEVRVAVKAQAMCRRTACQDRIPSGLRTDAGHSTCDLLRHTARWI